MAQLKGIDLHSKIASIISWSQTVSEAACEKGEDSVDVHGAESSNDTVTFNSATAAGRTAWEKGVLENGRLVPASPETEAFCVDEECAFEAFQHASEEIHESPSWK